MILTGGRAEGREVNGNFLYAQVPIMLPNGVTEWDVYDHDGKYLGPDYLVNARYPLEGMKKPRRSGA